MQLLEDQINRTDYTYYLNSEFHTITVLLPESFIIDFTHLSSVKLFYDEQMPEARVAKLKRDAKKLVELIVSRQNNRIL